MTASDSYGDGNTLAGFPVSAVIWKKAVDVANKEAELQDKLDGFD